jgi:hypothetical protein
MSRSRRRTAFRLEPEWLESRLVPSGASAGQFLASVGAMLPQPPTTTTIHPETVSAGELLSTFGPSIPVSSDRPGGDPPDMSAPVGPPHHELETAPELLSDRTQAASPWSTTMTPGNAQLVGMIDSVLADMGPARPESVQQTRAVLAKSLGPVSILGVESGTKDGLAGQPSGGAFRGGTVPSVRGQAAWAPIGGHLEYHFRSMILSRPSSEVQAANAADEQAGEPSPGQAVAAGVLLMAEESSFEFPDLVRRDRVDAPGGGPAPVAGTSETSAWGSPAEPGDLASLEEEAGRPTYRARRRPPAPAGHWVSARALAGMASGLILPNLILLGAGSSREPRASIRRTHWWWWRRRQRDP